MITLKDQLTIYLLGEFIAIDKELSHSVYLDMNGYINPRLFDLLLFLKWMAYCKRN